MRFFVSESSASALVVRVTRLRHGLIEIEFAGDDGSTSHRMLVKEAAQLSDVLKEVCAEPEVKP